MNNTTYFVWRRLPDGYVDASTYQPQGWQYRNSETGEQVTVSFEMLLTSTDWPECYTAIETARSMKSR